ncbi:MAG TPA: phosphatase PAP2 family protein [Micromonosporaceae bacterium]
MTRSRTGPITREAGARRPRPVPRGWWFDVLLVAGFVAITVALVRFPALNRWDLTVRDWVDGHRPPPVRWLVLICDLVGQGGPVMTVTLGVGFVLAWRYRTIRPILPAGLAPILTTASIVPLKRWTERGAPHYGPVELFSGPGYVEYPSGHVNNAFVYFATLALLLAPFLPVAARRILQWAPPFLVAFGTTYIAYHWFSDAVAGFLLGWFLSRVQLRIPWERIPLPARFDHAAQRASARPPADRADAVRAGEDRQ